MYCCLISVLFVFLFWMLFIHLLIYIVADRQEAAAPDTDAVRFTLPVCLVHRVIPQAAWTDSNTR